MYKTGHFWLCQTNAKLCEKTFLLFSCYLLGEGGGKCIQCIQNSENVTVLLYTVEDSIRAHSSTPEVTDSHYLNISLCFIFPLFQFHAFHLYFKDNFKDEIKIHERYFAIHKSLLGTLFLVCANDHCQHCQSSFATCHFYKYTSS